MSVSAGSYVPRHMYDALAAEVERLRERLDVLRQARPLYRESELGKRGRPAEQTWCLTDYQRRWALDALDTSNSQGAGASPSSHRSDG